MLWGEEDVSQCQRVWSAPQEDSKVGRQSTSAEEKELECRTTGRAGDVLPEPSRRGRSHLTAVETHSELHAGAGTVRLGQGDSPP